MTIFAIIYLMIPSKRSKLLRISKLARKQTIKSTKDPSCVLETGSLELVSYACFKQRVGSTNQHWEQNQDGVESK